ncbi:MAG: hypothetical protein MK102_13400 [Fuerstiella sp.]|nr:hypothetical protein [Fuerstiella sp.]
MQKLSLIIFSATAFAAGCLVGSSQGLSPHRIEAARQDNGRLSYEALLTYKKSNVLLNSLSEMLLKEERHKSATEGENYFALSVGGIDSLQDLEKGQGVDPETFAALYAGREIPQVAEHLETDNSGRIRYKGNIIRLYSRERLKDVFQRRAELQNRSGSVYD